MLNPISETHGLAAYNQITLCIISNLMWSVGAMMHRYMCHTHYKISVEMCCHTINLSHIKILVKELAIFYLLCC
jgi:hypothetical protein